MSSDQLSRESGGVKKRSLSNQNRDKGTTLYYIWPIKLILSHFSSQCYDKSSSSFDPQMYKQLKDESDNLFFSWNINILIEHMIYVIEGNGALVNEKGEETPLKAGDFALVNPDEKHQYRNKGDVPFKMICGVPKEFEW